MYPAHGNGWSLKQGFTGEWMSRRGFGGLLGFVLNVVELPFLGVNGAQIRIWRKVRPSVERRDEGGTYSKTG